MNKKVDCICDNCKKPLKQKLSEYNKHKNHFCSKKCHYNFFHEPIKCKNCGKDVDVEKGDNRKFCSHKCALEYNSSHQSTNREIIICKNCGKEFISQVSNNRKFCFQKCAYEWRRKHPEENKYLIERKEKAKEKFYIEFEENDLYIKIDLLSDYIDSQTKIHCKCKEHGNDFFMLPHKILAGQSGCTKCSYSKGENDIRDFLKENEIKFTPQKRFDDCRDKNPLPFDFYLDDYNILIEYDGEQHFHPVNWGGISDELAQKQYESVVAHDEIKNNYCRDKNIKLIRIPYYEKENIKDILNKEIL